MKFTITAALLTFSPFAAFAEISDPSAVTATYCGQGFMPEDSPDAGTRGSTQHPK